MWTKVQITNVCSIETCSQNYNTSRLVNNEASLVKPPSTIVFKNRAILVFHERGESVIVLRPGVNVINIRKSLNSLKASTFYLYPKLEV